MPTTPPPMIITLAAATPGHAAEQDAAPAERLLEHERARLRGDLARDLAHRRQQRQPAARVLDGLVGDAGRARVDQALRELGVRRQVQVGEQRVARLEQRDLDGLRLLDLDDHVGLGEHRGGVGQDLRALRGVLGVADRRALARARLDRRPRGRARPARARPAGVSATRYSSVLISVGTPTFMSVTSRVGPARGRAARARSRSGRARSPATGRSAPRRGGSGSAACDGDRRAPSPRAPTARCTR